MYSVPAQDNAVPIEMLIQFVAVIAINPICNTLHAQPITVVCSILYDGQIKKTMSDHKEACTMIQKLAGN